MEGRIGQILLLRLRRGQVEEAVEGLIFFFGGGGDEEMKEKGAET